MASAVLRLSPVNIHTLSPFLRSAATVPFASGFTLSAITTTPHRIPADYSHTQIILSSDSHTYEAEEVSLFLRCMIYSYQGLVLHAGVVLCVWNGSLERDGRHACSEYHGHTYSKVALVSQVLQAYHTYNLHMHTHIYCMYHSKQREQQSGLVPHGTRSPAQHYQWCLFHSVPSTYDFQLEPWTIHTHLHSAATTVIEKSLIPYTLVLMTVYLFQT